MRINKKRLLKLAAHLRSRNRGLKRFDFSQVCVYQSSKPVVKDSKVVIEPPCGTAGCAIGELPFAFPKDWKYDWMDEGFECYDPAEAQLTVDENGEIQVYDYSYEDGADPDLIGSSHSDDLWDNVCRFFGINMEEASHLFMPGNQRPSDFGGRDLKYSATPVQVASNIEAFCKKVK